MSDIRTSIFPMLAYEDGIAAMNWLCETFGFTERTRMLDDKGRLSHGELVFGEGMVMLSSALPYYESPKRHRQLCEVAAQWYEVPYVINGVLVLVDDVDQHYRKAKERGATILSEIETGGPGKRYRAEDLEGQRWMFMER